MNIDYSKLFRLILPGFLRTGLLIFVELMGSYFQNMYNSFKMFQLDVKLQAAVTCQVMYLEMILNKRLLNTYIRTINITSGDGVAVDFIVNVPQGVAVDNYRMIALIEKYKTAGKRYTIAQSTFTYDAAWSGQVCELKNVASDSYWSSFVCELEISNIIPNYLTINTDSGNIFVTSTYPVASFIQLSIQLITGTEDDPLFMLTIEPGSSESDIFVYGGSFIAVDLKSISPASDDVYEYISNF